MSVTAYPVILVDSATGSDSAASGSGPATALTGSAAVSTGTTVVLDAGTDLSGVATDGSHVLYFADATAGNRNFTAINGKSGSGGATPTVTVEQSLASTTKSWAIGGKRASIAGSVSKKLFDNNGSAGDCMPGWAVEMQSGHSETVSAQFDVRCAGDTTNGPIILRGKSGAATRPLLTYSAGGNFFIPRTDYQQYWDFECRATSGGTAFIITAQNPTVIKNIKISHSTNHFTTGINVGQVNKLIIRDCEIGYCSTAGISDGGGASEEVKIINCWIHNNAVGIVFTSAAVLGTVIQGCLITNNTGDGMNQSGGGNTIRGYSVIGNTFDGNGGDGLEIADTGDTWWGCLFLNNIFSNNGGYGINFSDGSVTAAYLQAVAPMICGNNFFGNTSGKYNPSGMTISENETTTDPTYTAAGSFDYSIGTNLKAKGYPVGGSQVVGGSATYSYVDPGAAQRQEAGGGGGVILCGGELSGGLC